ncbi:hypothetical protein FEM48_ZijujUnG0088600 [Ziziphus jujuba var. spinosa]|uniref:Reverse transcriptase domain-containing protein n=1 Tax=Ziziphus jujuba var. spinosa TaxID=714518 RepID=A0A978U8J8_ZIZJJ|nr:hypothetical protein FEM48_ZijujUnG0088600 [Ziziphus jujuba var. spinosa]
MDKESGVQRIKICKNAPAVSHLLYANDLLITCRANKENAKAIVKCLKTYCNWLVGWQSHLLSRAGKATLIRTVAQAIPIYTMSTFMVPKGVPRQMDSIIKRFWWSIKPRAKRILALKSWSSICKPKSVGGLGFKRFEDINTALIAKLG